MLVGLRRNLAGGCHLINESQLACVLCLIAFVLMLVCAAATARDVIHHERVKSGTGFFVSQNGLVITSAHVVAGCREIALWPADASELVARAIALDALRDVALLAATTKTERYADQILEGDGPHAGDPIATIGFGVLPSRPREPRLTSGRVIGGVTDSRGYPLLLIRADLREGNSGGPVIDNTGNLLGMVTGRDADRPELGVAVPANVITAFLTQHGITRGGSASLEKHPTNTTGFLTAISVLVQCMPPGH